MGTFAYVIGLIVFILLIGAVTSGPDHRRKGRNSDSRRGHRRGGRRRRYDDDDYYYDDRDDYYDDDRRGYRRRDRHYDQDHDYTGMFVGFGIILLVGFGIYQFNAQRSSSKTESAKIIMQQDNPDVNQNSSSNEELDYSGDDYPNHIYDDDTQDYDEDVGPAEEDIPDEYVADEQTTTNTVVPENFYAQSDAFGSLDNAIAAKQDWTEKGYLAKIVYFKEGDGLYHLLIGGYPSKRAAKSFMGKKYEQIYELVEGQYYKVD